MADDGFVQCDLEEGRSHVEQLLEPGGTTVATEHPFADPSLASKTDFEAILLRLLGPGQVSTFVTDTLFDEIGEENAGWNEEDVALYLRRERPSAFGDHIRFVAHRLLCASVEGSLLFFSASSISITNNLLNRSASASTVFAYLAPPLIMWLLTIGSICFVWAMIKVSRQLYVQGVPFAKKLLVIAWVNLQSLGQVANIAWFLGSVAYVVAVHGKTLQDNAQLSLCLTGGICYLVGGLLSVVSVYRGELAQIVESQKIVSKLSTMAGEAEEEAQTVQTDDLSSLSSDTTVASSQANQTVSHRRLASVPVVSKRSPTISLIPSRSCPTFDVEDTKALDINSYLNIEALGMKQSHLRRDTPKQGIDCSEAYLALEGVASLDAFLHVWREMSRNRSKLYPEDVHQYAFTTDRRKSAGLYRHVRVCRRLLHQPYFYTSVIWTVAGAFFTIGAIDVGLPDVVVSNFTPPTALASDDLKF